LSDLIGETIGPVDEWISNLDVLQSLSAYARKTDFVMKFAAVKRGNKERLRAWVKEHTGIDIPLDSLYDV